MRVARLILVGFIAIFVQIPAAAAEEPSLARMPHVRAPHRNITVLIEQGYERSATFRRLVDDLERSNVIVHLQRAPRPIAGAGSLQFVVTAGGQRYLRVYLNMRLPSPPLIGIIAHELMHALEIASAPEVVDEATMVALYRRIGRRNRHGYDTDTACDIGERVVTEVITSQTTKTRMADGS
jgi:hypothetical protein